MGIIELVDASAATALEHASQLQGHLQTAHDGDTIRECRGELHRLVADIISLRNAAELMKRELRPTG
ncbi:hypothetical protein [Nocardioides sp. URHA0020]|uniref:hypothetical protein n=1 Tax=Nocardioides sp. URHA0020 TaxID=1380392 RepID=UPI0004911C2E|nr:hypothetical protein [Nocardioides sp. URHA0020]